MSWVKQKCAFEACANSSGPDQTVWLLCCPLPARIIGYNRMYQWSTKDESLCFYYCSLKHRQEQWKKDEAERIANTPDPSVPEGHRVLPDNERRETLALLKKSRFSQFSLPTSSLYLTGLQISHLITWIFIPSTNCLWEWDGCVCVGEGGAYTVFTLLVYMFVHLSELTK